MKPNEHIKLPDDELIAHIKGQLMAHEEDYAPGSWENFNSEKPAKKRGMFFWLGSLSSAAALIMIGFAVFFMNDKKERLKPEVLTGTKPSNQQIEFPKERADNASKPAALAGAMKPEEGAADLKAAEMTSATVKVSGSDPKFVATGKEVNTVAGTLDQQRPVNNPANNLEHASTVAIPENTAIAVVGQEQKAVVAEAPVALKTQSLEEFLAQESKNGNARGRRTPDHLAALAMNNDKWEMGVMVAPSFGSSKKLNMGYGLSMGYALSKKISINSGISYNEMGASRTTPSAPGGGQMDMPSTTTKGLAGNSKELKAVDANLRGIDIPLEIRYRLTKNLYANVGVSAFAVLNQKQKNTFLESQVQSGPVDPGSSASMTFKANVLSTTVTQEQQTSDLKTDPYLGFYNFSLGYKQQISRGKSVSLEPFVKLPIKEFTQENLYLIGTGLRLKFDF
ncbi:hypothetical protein [Pedobacter gandavensis]|uniref:hypothetical protein n=1 Tax=Pedobacter gandavensis TaxID=2679963 RepID=UPI0029312B95|nr:hypothetical protein [Pedobacter gandavensis]